MNNIHINCQNIKCINMVYVQSYFGQFNDFRCASCQGLQVIDSRDQIEPYVVAGTYTVCTICHCQFIQMEDNFERNPKCPTCMPDIQLFGPYKCSICHECKKSSHYATNFYSHDPELDYDLFSENKRYSVIKRNLIHGQNYKGHDSGQDIYNL